MNRVCTIFYRILTLLPRLEFEAEVRKHTHPILDKCDRRRTMRRPPVYSWDEDLRNGHP